MSYNETADVLQHVWIAARRSLRDVFEEVSIQQLADGELPEGGHLADGGRGRLAAALNDPAAARLAGDEEPPATTAAQRGDLTLERLGTSLEPLDLGQRGEQGVVVDGCVDDGGRQRPQVAADVVAALAQQLGPGGGQSLGARRRASAAPGGTGGARQPVAAGTERVPKPATRPTSRQVEASSLGSPRRGAGCGRGTPTIQRSSTGPRSRPGSPAIVQASGPWAVTTRCTSKPARASRASAAWAGSAAASCGRLRTTVSRPGRQPATSDVQAPSTSCAPVAPLAMGVQQLGRRAQQLLDVVGRADAELGQRASSLGEGGGDDLAAAVVESEVEEGSSPAHVVQRDRPT